MGSIYAGVDIGGTYTKIGLLNEEFKLLANTVINTTINDKLSPINNVPFFLDQIAKEIGNLVITGDVSDKLIGIGIGVPGSVNLDNGFVYDATNLGWEEVDLTTEIGNRLHLPVFVEHDVSAYAIGENIAGAGIGYRNIICVTIGTGIAAGIIVDGNVVHGGSWSAGEIGHDTIDGENTKCGCGKIGCLETLVSGPGIVRSAEQLVLSGGLISLAHLKGKITASDVFSVAKQGDKQANKIFNYAGTVLGRKLSTLVYALDPEIIIIGGGVAAAGELLISPIRNEIEKQCKTQYLSVKVTSAILGNKAGLIGAAYLVSKLISKDRKHK